MPSSVNTLDLCMASVMLLMAARGSLRGFVPELSGLAAFTLAILAAGNHTLHSEATKLISSMLDDPAWANLLAYLGIFLCVFIVVSLVFRLIDRLLSTKALGWVDRTLGAVAGFLKGLMLCTLFLVGLYYLAPGSEIRRGSLLAPYINDIWQGVNKLTDGFHNFPDFEGLTRQFNNF